ncbi:hypothetical protein HDU97_010413 [Phlyctochytrium planicorne]|nr:hypothetical protein HDU97_010413 [Phlyctochytrium planicorne]
MSQSSLFAPSPPQPDIGNRFLEDFGFGLTTPSVVLETSSSQVSFPRQDFFVSDSTDSNFLLEKAQQQDQHSNFKYCGWGAESLVTPPPQSRNGSVDVTVAFHNPMTLGLALPGSFIIGPPSPTLSAKSENSNGTATLSSHSAADSRSRSFSVSTPDYLMDAELAVLSHASKINCFEDSSEIISFQDEGSDGMHFDFAINPELLTLNARGLATDMSLTASPFQSSAFDQAPDFLSAGVPPTATLSLGNGKRPATQSFYVPEASHILIDKPNSSIQVKKTLIQTANPLPSASFSFSNVSSQTQQHENLAVPRQSITESMAILSNAPPHPRLISTAQISKASSPSKSSPGSATTATKLPTAKSPIRPIVRPLPAANTKLFHCNLCNVQFKRSHDLKRHTRSLHTKVKPYVCVKCSKGFSRLDALKRHVARSISPCFVDVANGEVLVVPPFED